MPERTWHRPRRNRYTPACGDTPAAPGTTVFAASFRSCLPRARPIQAKVCRENLSGARETFFEHPSHRFAPCAQGARYGALRQPLAQRRFDQRFFFGADAAAFALRRPRPAALAAQQTLCSISVETTTNHTGAFTAVRTRINMTDHALILYYNRT